MNGLSQAIHPGIYVHRKARVQFRNIVVQVLIIRLGNLVDRKSRPARSHQLVNRLAARTGTYKQLVGAVAELDLVFYRNGIPRYGARLLWRGNFGSGGHAQGQGGNQWRGGIVTGRHQALSRPLVTKYLLIPVDMPRCFSLENRLDDSALCSGGDLVGRGGEARILVGGPSFPISQSCAIRRYWPRRSARP